MNTKHTPGLWSACCIHLTPHYVFAGKADTTICRIEINDPASDSFEPMSGMVTLDQARANARLIAAAPEMLALLIELTDIEGPLPGTAAWAKKVSATIAKATGKEDA